MAVIIAGLDASICRTLSHLFAGRREEAEDGKWRETKNSCSLSLKVEGFRSSVAFSTPFLWIPS